MEKILVWLDGRKTYITVIVLAIFNLGVVNGWWTMDNSYWATINLILGAFGFGFMRAGIAKSTGPVIPVEKKD